ncbi:hypothetical protein G5576_002278, partial [Homo sapiens]
VQNRIATFEEGRRLKEEAQKRRERIDEIKRKKLEELSTAVCCADQRGWTGGPVPGRR